MPKTMSAGGNTIEIIEVSFVMHVVMGSQANGAKLSISYAASFGICMQCNGDIRKEENSRG